MRRVLATETGGALSAKRQTMVEPIFADTKFNCRIDRFLRRGRAAARSEWRLTTAAHNLLKLYRHTTTPCGEPSPPVDQDGRSPTSEPAGQRRRRDLGPPLVPHGSSSCRP